MAQNPTDVPIEIEDHLTFAQALYVPNAETSDRDLDAFARVIGTAERFWDYPFAVGDEVRWWLIPMDDRKYGYLGDEYSMEVRRGLTHWLQWASWGEEPPRNATRARVTSIEAVYIDYEMRPEENENFPMPVPGSAVYEQRQQTTGAEPHRRADGLSFVGYIVDLAPWGLATRKLRP